MKRLLKKSIRGEKGQAFVIVLILLVVGGLIIAPLLSFMGTGLIVGKVYEERMFEFYAADAGVEDALWQVTNDKMPALFPPSSPNPYSPYAFYEYSSSYQWSYILNNINNISANITIENVWIPQNITAPNELTARTIIETGKLVVVSSTSAAPVCEIGIHYYYDAGENLLVTSIGIWLPPGFSYAGNCNLMVNPLDPYYPDSEQVIPHAGGEAVVWSYATPVPFADFPNGSSPPIPTNPTDPLQQIYIAFDYTASNPGDLPDAIAWISTQGVGSIPFAWDADTKAFKMVSTSGNTTIEAHCLKNELRQLEAAIAGDYRAIGNSLMVEAGLNPNPRARDQLLAESDATIDDIPDDAYVVAAYLYWSGWFWEGPGSGTVVFYDDATDWVNPPINWTNGSRWSIFNFNEFRGRGGSSTSDRTVTMTNSFDLSAYSSQNVDISWQQRETGWISPFEGLRYAFYNSSGWSSDYVAFSGDIGSSFQDFSITIPSQYLTSDFKVRFFWEVTDSGDWVYIDNITITVSNYIFYDEANDWVTPPTDWTNGSRWSNPTSSEFRGRGGSSTSDRTLTMTNSFDLSAYSGQSIDISWQQRETGNIWSTEGLRYAFYNSSGWSSDYVAFNNDIGSSFQNFSVTIPNQYLTADFKVRFFWEVTDSGDYVYIDDITIAETKVPADKTSIFKINGTQVYLDSNGLPQIGAQELTADDVQTIDITAQYVPPQQHGYSYSCKKDVTALVQAYSNLGNIDEDGDGFMDNHTGNADYTCGDVDADEDRNDEWAYAGWSLIVIYASSATQGHQLYLYDTFSYCASYTNLDFDHDGNPGGTISGFLVPSPIPGEVIASKMTAFVGEGDSWYTGDYLQFNGTQLPDDDDTQGLGGTNYTNVWNGQSIGMSAEGVDVDTFYIRWDDGLLLPADTSAQIDIWTNIDIWNLVYIILSFRSEASTGGTVSYVIK